MIHKDRFGLRPDLFQSVMTYPGGDPQESNAEIVWSAFCFDAVQISDGTEKEDMGFCSCKNKNTLLIGASFKTPVAYSEESVKAF